LGVQKTTLGDPKGTPGDPKTTLRVPKTTLSIQKTTLGVPKAAPGDTKTTLRVPKATPGDPKAAPGGGHGGHPDLLEVVDGEGQVLQGEEDLLQEGDVVGGFGAGEPRVEQLVAPDPDKSWGKTKENPSGAGQEGGDPPPPQSLLPPHRSYLARMSCARVCSKMFR